MRRIGKKYRKFESQKDIDKRQDEVNTKQDLVNYYQSTALIIYGLCLLGIFVVAVFGGLIR